MYIWYSQETQTAYGRILVTMDFREQSGGGVRLREKGKREKKQTLDGLMKSKKDLSEAMVDGVQPFGGSENGLNDTTMMLATFFLCHAHF